MEKKMEFLWANMSWPEIKEAVDQNAIVMIPVGSIEQHGEHLPLGTDTTICFEIAKKAAERLQEKARILVTPPLWTGYSAHHMRFPGTLSLEVNTLSTVIFQLCRSINNHGFNRIVLLNGHGGNNSALQAASQEIGEKLRIPAVVVKLLNLLKEHIEEVRKTRPNAYRSHAGELETSLQLVLSPQLVKKNFFRKVDTYPASKFHAKIFVYDGNWEKMTPKGGVGDPHAANEKKGKELMGIVVDELTKFLLEFKTWDILGFWPPQSSKMSIEEIKNEQ